MNHSKMTDRLVPYWIAVREQGGGTHLEMRWVTPGDLASLKNHDAA